MRRLLGAIGIAGLCAVAGCGEEPDATAPSPGPAQQPAEGPVTIAEADRVKANLFGIAAWAVAAVEYTVPPELFGAEVGNELSFYAFRLANGRVGGRFHYEQSFMGDLFVFSGEVSCITIHDDRTRAKIGGPITESNDPTIPVGTFGWWQSLDNGTVFHGPPDQNTLLGFGDEAENQAFCDSPDPPRFGPFDVHKGVLIVD